METRLWNWTMSASLLPVVVLGFSAQADEPPFLPLPMPVPSTAASDAPTELMPLALPLEKMEAPPSNVVSSPQEQSMTWRQTPPTSHSKQRHPIDRGFPERLNPPELGSVVQRFQMLQIAHGQAARMALYQYDFLANSDQLNASGHRQLSWIAHRAIYNDFPIYIEPVRDCPGLTALRHQAVWHHLSLAHGEFPVERIVIGSPRSRGLDAMDSISIDRNRQEMTNSRGISAGGGEATSVIGNIGTSNRSDQ